MGLLQQIKDASLTARKSKHPTATFLVTLYSESAKVGKDKRNDESTDEEVIQVLKKFKVGAETMIDAALNQNRANAQTVIDQSNNELRVLSQFLPTMMGEAELTAVIFGFVVTLEDCSIKQMGPIMNHLKTSFPGLYDGAMASRIIKSVLGQ